MRKILYICLLVLLLGSCFDRFGRLAWGDELEVSYEIETVCIDSHCYDLLVERMWADEGSVSGRIELLFCDERGCRPADIEPDPAGD